MSLSERIKRLFRRPPRTAEERDAQAEERAREQARDDETAIRDELGPRIFKY